MRFSERPLAIALGIAAIAHAFVIGVVRPVRHAAAPVAIPEPVDTIQVYAEEPEPAPRDQPQGGALVVAPSKHLALTTKSKSRAPSAVTIDVPPAPSGAPTPSTTGSEPPKTASPFPSLINLDSPGSHAVIFSSSSSSADVPVSKEVAAAKKLDTQLKSALDAKDTETGTGFGGPVVSAAHSAAGPSTALGYATFDVTTNAFGVVTMVRVVDFGGDSKGWQAMAKDIHSTLGSHKLRVPTGAAGVSVRIRVEAAMKYPSGALKPITPMVGAGTVGGEFDVADIGQSKKRVVSVRIVAENRI